jgi:long-chain acyl-CoA synthetase
MTRSREHPWLAQYVNVPPRLEPPGQTVIEAFDRCAAREPDRPAIWFHQEMITRGELRHASRRLAHALTGLGIREGDRIAVMGQNTPALALAMLGSWRAGAAVVPLNPMLKAAEVRKVLADSQVTAVIAAAALWQRLAAGAWEGSPLRAIVLTGEQIDERPVLASGGRAVLPTMRMADLVDNGSSPDPVSKASLDGIAALMYTSGTTGGPKGAVIRHRHLAFTTEVYRRWMRIDDIDVILGAAPLSHITGLVAGLTLSLASGAPLILSGRFDARATLRLAARHRTTFTVAAITAYRALMADDTVTSADLSSLTKAYSGGAPVPAATVERFERLTGVYIHPIYGLTETTSPSHATPLGVRAPIHPSLGTLAAGVPVPSTYSAILDPDSGDEIPAGQAGEVVIAGPGVVEEYWKRPEITAATIPGGLLHTGDVGLMDADGWFYIIDRIKDIINTSGYKVWPREVEDVLLQHPGVAETAVVGAPDPYRGETVVAYVVPRSGHGPSAEELIEYSRARLAAFKYPRRIEFCDQLPTTASGKILRRALRENQL